MNCFCLNSLYSDVVGPWVVITVRLDTLIVWTRNQVGLHKWAWVGPVIFNSHSYNFVMKLKNIDRWFTKRVNLDTTDRYVLEIVFLPRELIT